jgi:hypothetical protein
LFNLCKAFDLRFHVIKDRFEFNKTIEEIKERYYTVSKIIMSYRQKKKTNLYKNNPILQFNYNIEYDLERKSIIEKMLNRPKEIEERENYIKQKLKQIEKIKKLRNMEESPSLKKEFKMTNNQNSPMSPITFSPINISPLNSQNIIFDSFKNQNDNKLKIMSLNVNKINKYEEKKNENKKNINKFNEENVKKKTNDDKEFKVISRLNLIDEMNQNDNTLSLLNDKIPLKLYPDQKIFEVYFEIRKTHQRLFELQNKNNSLKSELENLKKVKIFTKSTEQN